MKHGMAHFGILKAPQAISPVKAVNSSTGYRGETYLTLQVFFLASTTSLFSRIKVYRHTIRWILEPHMPTQIKKNRTPCQVVCISIRLSPFMQNLNLLKTCSSGFYFLHDVAIRPHPFSIDATNSIATVTS
jgi:hypothetical protein